MDRRRDSSRGREAGEWHLMDDAKDGRCEVAGKQAGKLLLINVSQSFTSFESCTFLPLFHSYML
jgi:hypothetical protein